MRANYNARPCDRGRKAAEAKTMANNGKNNAQNNGNNQKSEACTKNIARRQGAPGANRSH
jgi:hypothetical protein